ncbi:kinase-like protein [Schizopora paradoxa]|uniref:Kinase-like protein n=1 Tax=Schizopora paradoxa TaxID=27342 RepID=A0A0H2SDV2_9AGAM|nr:kinase-like protein [Schizopora paradoxa]
MHLEDNHRGHFLDTLLQLAVQAAIIPKCLVISGVTDRGEFPITTGGFGDVWKAYWSDKTVALKMLRPTQDESKIHRNLCKEVLLWRQLKHPNLLEFIGICKDALPSPAIVSPWMENGNVLQFVKTQSIEKKLHLLSQVANALAYLHSYNPVVVHQDIRCANILVNEYHEAVLSDFGLSRLDSNFFNSFTSSLEHGCLRWQAPELVFPEPQFLSTPNVVPSNSDEGVPSLPKPTAQTDIYALGMTALELITEKRPFSTLAMDTAVVIDLYHHRTPARPSESDIPGTGALSDDIWHLLSSCWSRNPMERPSAKSISDLFMDKVGQAQETKMDALTLPESQAFPHDLLLYGMSSTFKFPLRSFDESTEEPPEVDGHVEERSRNSSVFRGVRKHRKGNSSRRKAKQTARKSTGGISPRQLQSISPVLPKYAESSKPPSRIGLPENDIHSLPPHPFTPVREPQVPPRTPDEQEDWNSAYDLLEALSEPHINSSESLPFSHGSILRQDNETEQTKDNLNAVLKETKEPTFQGFTHQMDPELAATDLFQLHDESWNERLSESYVWSTNDKLSPPPDSHKKRSPDALELPRPFKARNIPGKTLIEHQGTSEVEVFADITEPSSSSLTAGQHGRGRPKGSALKGLKKTLLARSSTSNTAPYPADGALPSPSAHIRPKSEEYRALFAGFSNVEENNKATDAMLSDEGNLAGPSRQVFRSPTLAHALPAMLRDRDRETAEASASQASGFEIFSNDEEETSSVRTPRRTSVACMQCRSRKLRCDGATPKCLSCTQRHIELCDYEAASKRRGPDRLPGTRQRSCKTRSTPETYPISHHRDGSQSLRVPPDFIQVALGENVVLFEEKHGVKITAFRTEDGISNELRIDRFAESYEAQNVTKELENLLEFYWRFGLRQDVAGASIL